MPVCTTTASKQLPCVWAAFSRGNKYYLFFLVVDNLSERDKNLSLCSPWHLASPTNLVWLKAKLGLTLHAMKVRSKSHKFVYFFVWTPFIKNRDVPQQVDSAFLFNTAAQYPCMLLQSQIPESCSVAPSSHFVLWTALSSMWICWELDGAGPYLSFGYSVYQWFISIFI